MDKIVQKLFDLVSISENNNRSMVYKNFLYLLQTSTNENKNKILDRMYTNFSGILAHSELKDNEYVILEQLLKLLDKYFN